MSTSPVRALKARLRSVYARITLTRVTTAYFIFSFIHCFSQGIIQSTLLSIDSQFNSVLTAITDRANIPTKNLTFLEGPYGNLNLQICDDIPHGQSRYPCTEVFRSSIDVRSDDPSRTPVIFTSINDGLIISSVRDTSRSVIGVNVTSKNTSKFLDPQCAQTLVYPRQLTRNSKREDVGFILLQFWLFATSVIAISYDSVPHTLTVLITRILITAWSIYAVWRTRDKQKKIEEMIMNPGTPCSVDIFPSYFQTRVAYQIPDLILNCTALLIALYLSWTLLQVYSAQSFKHVGPPKHISRIHKFFMAVLACLHLEAFALAAAMGLWIDVLFNTAIAAISAHTNLYKGLFILSIILLLPWITLGWYAIRREKKAFMAIFLGIAFILLLGWSLMFYSIVYRWTFVQFPYLSCYTVASHTLLVATVILGVICWLNFGKGLSQYLHAEEALASSNFAPEVFLHDEEKASFDLGTKVPIYPAPTYAYSPSRSSSGHESPDYLDADARSQGVFGRVRPTATAYNVPYNVPF